MTVDYDDGRRRSVRLARLITERTGMQATVQGESEGSEGSAPSWWSRYGRWVLTAGSGLALAVGLAFSWLGPALGLSATAAGRLAVPAYAVGRGGRAAWGCFPRRRGTWCGCAWISTC